MSRRELRSLAELGSNSCMNHRLRSGQSQGSPLVMESDGQAVEANDSHTTDVQELREKLQMAQEELELVRADLTRRLEQAQQSAADERTSLAEQLQQAQQMAEAANEEGEEQRCKAQEAERQLDGQARENDDLRRQLQESEEKTGTEVQAVRLRLELERLRQLEEVRRQFDERYAAFDKERDWYRRKHDQDLAAIADLRARLEDSERRPDGIGESHESDIGADAPLHVEGSEGVLGEGGSLHMHSGEHRVTFDDDSEGGPEISLPISQGNFITDTTNRAHHPL